MTLLSAGVYFLIYSFLGWLLDSLDRTIDNRRLTLGGCSDLPFAPIYGFGALLTIFTYEQVRFAPLLVQFLFYTLLMGYFEYVGGVVSERIFKQRFWDYSGNRCNFDGHTDLIHALAWGILALTLIYFIHPIVVRMA
jgi:uncharacterized membrane protein